MTADSRNLLGRIDRALTRAGSVFDVFGPGRVAEMQKEGGDPVTSVDLEIDDLLHDELLRPGEGWLSEETADDASRLDKPLVWVVDPLDGTREFVDGLPEFCTSVAAVVKGRPVAGGVLNPAAGLRILGALGQGVTCNGDSTGKGLPGSQRRVLASRSEYNRGQWNAVKEAGWEVIPMGSVAYKLARVAAGLDPATWTPVPKHEWDVAGGAALLRAAGGTVVSIDGDELTFNQSEPWLPGAIAVPSGFDAHLDEVKSLVSLQRAGE